MRKRALNGSPRDRAVHEVGDTPDEAHGNHGLYGRQASHGGQHHDTPDQEETARLADEMEVLPLQDVEDPARRPGDELQKVHGCKDGHVDPGDSPSRPEDGGEEERRRNRADEEWRGGNDRERAGRTPEEGRYLGRLLLRDARRLSEKHLADGPCHDADRKRDDPLS